VAGFIDGKVSFTLRISVKGDAVAGPAYIGGADSPLSASGGDGGLADGGSALRLAGFAALGAGTVLVLSLAVWTVSARRRSVDAVR
jgi:hypothetical protein